MTNDESLLYKIAISNIPGIGPHLTRQLISYCGGVENVFNEPKNRLSKIPGIGEKLSKEIQSTNHLYAAEEKLKIAQKNNTQILFYTDKHYPLRLKNLFDAPTLLYYKGTADINAQKIISIVGTRNATEYGKEITEAIIKKIKPYTPTIVSGLAYGIDIAAHHYSLENTLDTIGVMATGLDIIYPSIHKKYALKLLDQGGLITEYPFQTKPEPSRFPARNRIIAGLADATIVIEAAEKGGALITADIANSYNREVFAVPGNINNRYSSGCNQLIYKNEAQILTDPDQIVNTLNWNTSTQNKQSTNHQLQIPDSLEPNERHMLHVLLEHDFLTIDEICWKTQISISTVTPMLLNLELQGLIKLLPGKKYRVVY